MLCLQWKQNFDSIVNIVYGSDGDDFDYMGENDILEFIGAVLSELIKPKDILVEIMQKTQAVKVQLKIKNIFFKDYEFLSHWSSP